LFFDDGVKKRVVAIHYRRKNFILKASLFCFLPDDFPQRSFVPGTRDGVNNVKKFPLHDTALLMVRKCRLGRVTFHYGAEYR
jgi:hypothetical protein